jgi:hypothetical protein
MDTLELEKKYAAHDARYREYRQAYEQANIAVRFPVAAEVLFDLAERMDDIYQGMIDLAKWENVYSILIQYRALVEHCIKFQYIVHKTTEENSDSTAEQYKKHLFISEVLAEQAGVLDMEDLLNQAEKQTDFIEFLIKRFPGLEGFDKSNQQELSAAIGQFNLKTMVKHLTGEFRKRATPDVDRMMAMILPEFSQVSSFTHGGAYAGQLMKLWREGGTVEDQINNKLGIGLTMLGISKENCLLVYEIDRSVLGIVKELQSLRSISDGQSAAQAGGATEGL